MRSPVRFSLAFMAALVLGMCFLAAPRAEAQAANNYHVSQSNDGVIVPGTTQVALPGCGISPPGDDCVGNVALPFAFQFYEQTYTAAVVSSNGNLQFNSSNNDYGQNEVCFPLSQFGFAILPHFADLTVGRAGEGVFTSVSGDAPNRIFNIEWRAAFLGGSPGTLNFEIRLYEGQQRFEIIYGNVPGGGRDATVGVQRQSGGAFDSYECRAGGLFAGLRLDFTGFVATGPYIAGRVTDTNNQPIGGVTINLTGAATDSRVTDANGQYLFDNLSLGATYTVTPAPDAFTYFPASRTQTLNSNYVFNFIRTLPVNPGDVIISEFRLRGPTPAAGGPPTGARDEFVELYNNTNSNIVVTTTDGSFGWTITSSNTAAAPVTATIPNGTIIPARAHYLAANGSGYSLAGFASADTFFSGDIPDDTGLALVRTTTVANYSQPGFLLDAVGFNTDNNPFYREGTGLAPIGSTDGEMSFLRRLTPGTPLDTGVNTNDFILVSTNAANFNGVQSILGAPGPENLASPIQRNAFVKAQLVDPQCGNFGDATTACARVRNGTPVTNGAAGTLAIRRRFTNATGQKITRLRFRIVDLTTLGNLQAGEADLRALSSSDISVTNTASQSVQISGLTLEQSALQPNGGGINSTLSAGSITFSTPLAPGAGVNVEFRLGVQNNGSFRFFVNVEALTTNANVASLAPSKANVVSRKTKELQAEHSTQKR